MKRRPPSLIGRTSLILSVTLFVAFFASFVWVASGYRNWSTSSITCFVYSGDVYLVYQGGPELVQRFAWNARRSEPGARAHTASQGIGLLHLLSRPNLQFKDVVYRALVPYF